MRRLTRIRQTAFGPAAYVAEVMFAADGTPTEDRAEAQTVARSWWDAERSFLGEEYGRLLVDADAHASLTADAETGELEAETGEETETVELEGGAPFAGVVAFEGLATGDGRMIEPGALTWETPLPLRWVDEDTGAHAGARVVGIIDELERDGDAILARGRIDLGSEVGREAARQLAAGLAGGVSADLDSVDVAVRVAAELLEEPEPLAEGEELPEPEVDADGRVEVARLGGDAELLVTEAGRIRAATLVAIPAFAEARLELVEPDAELEAEAVSIVAAAGLAVGGVFVDRECCDRCASAVAS